MNAIIVLVLCVTALGTVVCQKPSPFFVGRRDAKPGEVPSMVSLSSEPTDRKHFCSGSILDSTHILTTVYCIDGMDPITDHIKARIGSLDLNKGGVQYDVIYDESFGVLTILCTAKEMVLDSTLPVPTGKVSLPTGNTVLAPGTMVRVAGWGFDTIEGIRFTDKLQVADIPIVRQEDCRRGYGALDFPDISTFICAGAEGLGPCFGEWGSPLTLGGVQYGMAFSCNDDPNSFIDVNYFSDSINTTIQKKCLDVNNH